MPADKPDFSPEKAIKPEEFSGPPESKTESKDIADTDFQATMNTALGIPEVSDSAERIRVSEGFAGMHEAFQKAFKARPELAGELMAKIEAYLPPETDEEANAALFEKMSTTPQTASDLLGDLNIPA